MPGAADGDAKTRCVNGHYVCSDCHMQGLDSIVELCLRETACDPIASWLAVPGRRGLCPGAPGVEMQHSVPVCSYSARNSQCIGKRCPFSAAKQRALEAKTAPSF